MHEMQNIDPTKASQDTDILIKITKNKSLYDSSN